MRLIIFDCDGTLVDSQHLIVSAMNSAFDACEQLRPERLSVIAVIGLSLDQAISRLASDADEQQVELLSAAYREAFVGLRQNPEHSEPLFPGADDVLATLAHRSDTVLGIATGKSRRGVDVLLERFDLRDCFSTIQTADDAPSKPHPAMIEQALAETGADRGATVMVGDTTYDMIMARTAGVHALGVTWGYHPQQELSRAGADRLADGFGELENACEALLMPRDAAE